MDEFLSSIKEFLILVLTPATFFGAAGGLIRAVRRKGGWKQVLVEMVSGIILANTLFPVVAYHLPEAWHYTAFFLVGWGGIEAIGWLYGVLFDAAQAWTCKKMGITPDELREIRNKRRGGDGENTSE